MNSTAFLEKLIRALTNVGMELRNLSFAVTTPKVPDWFKPNPRNPKPEDLDCDEWRQEYEMQRCIEWPEKWLELRKENLMRRIAENAKIGRVKS